MTSRSTRSLMPEEDFDAAIEELLQFAADRGREIRDQPGRVYVVSPKKPDIQGLLKSSLRASLEDEIVPAIEAQDGEIDPTEIEHEIIKKALIGLKVSDLRSLARDRGVGASGVAEELASRVARAYDWDPEAVARLVLSHEDEPSAERGHVSRMFPMTEDADLTRVAERLSFVEGRYVRVGVARWFVFESIDTTTPDVVEVTGSYRAYRATVDEVDGQPDLVPWPDKKPARVEVRANKLLNVKNTGVQPAKGAARAMALAGDLTLRGYVPFAGTSAKGIPGKLHPTSEFMLDLLSNRLRHAGLFNLNLTVTRFKVQEDSDDEQDDFSRPALKAVRFEGRHLLDSIDACRLLAIDNRPLVDMALFVSHKSDGAQGMFPVKVAIENDHVLVATGYGSIPELSPEVHRMVIEAVSSEINDGVESQSEIDEFALRIAERARESRTPDEATMLSADED